MYNLPVDWVAKKTGHHHNRLFNSFSCCCISDGFLLPFLDWWFCLTFSFLSFFFFYTLTLYSGDKWSLHLEFGGAYLGRPGNYDGTLRILKMFKTVYLIEITTRAWEWAGISGVWSSSSSAFLRTQLLFFPLWFATTVTTTLITTLFFTLFSSLVRALRGVFPTSLHRLMC